MELPKIHYCNKKSSNISCCSNVATKRVKLIGKSEKFEYAYRCEEHANTPTVNKKVAESLPIDQSNELNNINQYLQSLIGKNIVSKVHTARQLRVKYVMPEKGGVMCFQEHSKKWKFVYYDQIIKVL